MWLDRKMQFRIPNQNRIIRVVIRKARHSMFTGIAIGTAIFLGSLLIGVICFLLLA